MTVNQDKLGLYKRLKLEKIKKELEEIQSNGKESILLIAERLIKELKDQGYDVTSSTDDTDDVWFTFSKFMGYLNLSGHKFDVKGRYQC